MDANQRQQVMQNSAIAALQSQRNTALDACAQITAQLIAAQQDLAEMTAERDALKKQLETATRPGVTAPVPE